MKPNHLSLAVHLHLYYFDMWQNIEKYLKNLGDYKYHLYVTMVKDNPAVVKQIKAFHPDTTFFVIPNKGYDVGPFIYFLNKIDLKQYDLILKIHTKNNRAGCNTLINRRFISRKVWFKLLLSGLCGSSDLFKKNIAAFEAMPKLGMVGSRYLITSGARASFRAKEDVKKLMSLLGYAAPQDITFVAGTMFIVRAQLLEKIKAHFTLADFEPTNGRIKDGTLAHTLERVFGCLTIANGYTIQGFEHDYWFVCSNVFSRIARFICQAKRTQNNRFLIKIFKIPVFHKKIERNNYA